jgi:hypothetical protein
VGKGKAGVVEIITATIVSRRLLYSVAKGVGGVGKGGEAGVTRIQIMTTVRRRLLYSVGRAMVIPTVDSDGTALDQIAGMLTRKGA